MTHHCFNTKEGKIYYQDTLLKGVSPEGFEVLINDTYPMYVKDKKGVWFFLQYGKCNTTRFITEDVDSFEALDRYYCKDHKTVFYNGAKINQADAKTFQVHGTLASDKHAIYADAGMREGFQIWKDFDPESVQFLKTEAGLDYIFADKFQLVIYNHHFFQITNPHHPRYEKHKKVLRREFPNTKAWWNLPDDFHAKLQHIKYNYYTNGEYVFYHFKENENYCPQYEHPLRDEAYLIIPNADVQSFQVLNKYYSKDKENIFSITRKIAAHYNTFEPMEEDFAKDKNGLWYNGYLTENIDFQSLQLSIQEENVYAWDKNHLYPVKWSSRIGPYKGYAHLLKKENAGDAATFTVLSNAFAKDKNQVYWYGKVWKVADPETFEFLFENNYSEYAKDKQFIYQAIGKKVFKKIDGSSFKVLNAYWAKDRTQVVYINSALQIMRNADVNTFKVLDNKGTARDKNYDYLVDGWLRKKAIL